MLPQLSDLDASRLSPEARNALAAARRVYVDDQPIEEVAADLDLAVDELHRRFEQLAAEWREHSGISSLPKLTDEEYEALRDSIAAHGQLVPVLADVAGNVIDGRARLRACRELDIEPRIEYLADVPAEQLKSLALVVNLARRQLTASARRGIIRDELLRDATRSDRAIASLVGVSHVTVGSVRRELEQNGAVDNLSTRVGKNGVPRPAAQPARTTIKKPDLPDGFIDVTLRLTRELAEQLDGSAWLDCHAVRLVLVDAGTYTLELRT